MGNPARIAILQHLLASKVCVNGITLSEKVLGLEDLEIEVKCQSDTIGKYGLAFDGESFALTTKMTDCLAKESCGVSQSKPKVRLGTLSPKEASCAPEGGCC